jgi:hypothetical protein
MCVVFEEHRHGLRKDHQVVRGGIRVLEVVQEVAAITQYLAPPCKSMIIFIILKNTPYLESAH